MFEPSCLALEDQCQAVVAALKFIRSLRRLGSLVAFKQFERHSPKALGLLKLMKKSSGFI
jgi:hypothetical protein